MSEIKQYFNYRAVDANGNTTSSSLYARDISDAKRQISETGLIAVKIVKGNDLGERLKRLTQKKIGIAEISLFCRQLHIILSSGVNILNGLDIIRRQTKNKVMNTVVEKLFNEVQKGHSLSEAMTEMEDVLPPLLVNMVSSGEVSGNLDEVLRRMSVYYEKENYMRQKLRGAMIYPVILVFAGIIMIVGFINFVLPEVIKMITDTGGELPVLTKVVIGAVDAVKKYYLIFFGVVAALLIAIKLAVPKDIYRLNKDKLIMKIPLLSTSMRNVVTARFMRTLSMMLKGGIPLLHSMESIEKIAGNALVEQGIKSAQEGVKKGERLGDNIASCNFFDPIVTHMINMGEETGELDNILENMADYYDKEAETWILKTMAAIEPAFIIIIGAFLAVLILSMMLPMFNMISSFKVG